jgi:hypothetical protein
MKFVRFGWTFVVFIVDLIPLPLIIILFDWHFRAFFFFFLSVFLYALRDNK